MSRYLLDKFLYTVDRDPDLVERYRADPGGTVAWWEAERANMVLNCHAARPAPGCASRPTSGTRWWRRTTSASSRSARIPS